MTSLKCIVHYTLQDARYSKIKQVSEVNWDRIQAAKSIRETKGGANHHKHQCDSVPEKKNTETTPSESTSSRSSLRRKRPLPTPDMRDVFPKECNFCKRWRVKRKQAISMPITITTKMAEERIKRAAESKDEQLFYEIKNMDMIAKEFKYHDFCYKDFTRKEPQPSNQFWDTRGDFDAVVSCIEGRIVLQNEAISMATTLAHFGVKKYVKTASGSQFEVKIPDAVEERITLSCEDNSGQEELSRSTSEADYHPNDLKQQEGNRGSYTIDFKAKVINSSGKHQNLLAEQQVVEKFKAIRAKPSDGLDKRQCTLQLCIRPTDVQPVPPAVIFRGKGNIKEEELKLHDPRVNVFWQKNGWMDKEVAQQWVEKTFSPSVDKSQENVLFLDNLNCQTSEEFVFNCRRKANTVVYPLPPSSTDKLQPVDAGEGRQMQKLIGEQLDKYLEDAANMKAWCESSCDRFINPQGFKDYTF
eukprot:gene8583-9501_t